MQQVHLGKITCVWHIKNSFTVNSSAKVYHVRTSIYFGGFSLTYVEKYLSVFLLQHISRVIWI